MKVWTKIILCIFTMLLVFSGIAAAQSSYLDFFRPALTNDGSSYMKIFFRDTTQTAQTGSLNVQSNPAGAQVFLANKNYGVTPLTITDLKTGFYQVQLTRQGYISWSNFVTIRSGVTGNIQATLIPMPQQVIPLPTVPTPTPTQAGGSSGLGSLIIRSSPEGASISMRSNFFDPSEPMLDGKWHDGLGLTPVYWMNVMPPGSYTIALNRGEPAGWCTTVVIRAGETTEINGAPLCPFCSC